MYLASYNKETFKEKEKKNFKICCVKNPITNHHGLLLPNFTKFTKHMTSGPLVMNCSKLIFKAMQPQRSLVVAGIERRPKSLVTIPANGFLFPAIEFPFPLE